MKLYEKFIEEYFRFLSHKTSPLCETTLPYHPDFAKARRLGTRYFYDPSVLRYLQCYAENIAEDNDRRLISQFETTKTLSNGKTGAAVIYNQSTLLKVPLYSKKRDKAERGDYLRMSMAEYLIGMELNKLELPNLMKTYAAFTAPLPEDVQNDKEEEEEDEKGEIENIGMGKEQGVYLALEFIQARGDLKYMVDLWAKEKKLHEIIVCFLQIFYTLWIANDKLGFVHSDLHNHNILVIELKEPAAIPYFLPNGETVVLVTPYVVKLIDFGYSRINISVPTTLKKKYGTNISIAGTDWDETNKISTKDVKDAGLWGGEFQANEVHQTAKGVNLSSPFFDLFKIFSYCLDSIELKNFYYFKILSVMVEYIDLLKRYINFETRETTIHMEKYSEDELETFSTTKLEKIARNYSLNINHLSKHELVIMISDYYLNNNVDSYFDLSPKMVREAEKNLTMTGFHQHLQWFLFSYLDVQYVYLQRTNVPKTIYWLECNETHIHRLTKEGFSGMNSCRTLEQAKTEMNYNLFNVSTLADYLEKYQNQWKRIRSDELIKMANEAYLRGVLEVDTFIKNIKRVKRNYRMLVMKHKIMINDLILVRKFLTLKDNRLEGYKQKLNKFVNW